jgi:hypothetical protein
MSPKSTERALDADIGLRLRHHRRMELVAFWTGEILFYVALVASGAATVLALTERQNESYFKLVAAMPPVLLMLVGTMPLGSRAAWHGRYADHLDALQRGMSHQGKSAETTSSELTRVIEQMGLSYPKAKWTSGRSEIGRDDTTGKPGVS